MNKPCARPECGKTVYPIEELKCLDKVWHKPCFKCTVCGMTLNMKNYKGYNKMPYCEAHYPKTKATVVADTPEMKRLTENTKNQSLIKYHADFEKQKGHKIEIADDPEVQRALKNTAVQSQAAYHHEIDRKEMMERLRPMENGAQQGDVESVRTNHSQQQHKQQPVSPQRHPMDEQQQQQQKTTPYSGRQAQGDGSAVIYSSDRGGRVQPSGKQVGKIDDYDPLNGNWGTVGGARPYQPNPPHAGPPQLPPLNSQQQQQSPRMPAAFTNQPSSPPHSPQKVQQPPQQQAQAAPVRTGHQRPSNQSAAQAAHQLSRQAIHQAQQPAAGGQMMTPPPQQPPQQHHQSAPVQHVHRQSGNPPPGAFRAMFDYEAADYDEVSFREGDIVINCQPVDEGWMTGTVQRTGKFGMLPANYVEQVH